MKDKVLTLIIGILIGAILASGGFLIYNNVKSNDKTTSNTSFDRQMPQMQNGEMPSGGFGGKHDKAISNDTSSDNSTENNPFNGQMPTGEKPDGEPPAKPGEATTTNDSTTSNS